METARQEVLIGMDANKNVDNPHSQIACLFDKTDLIDLHHHRFPAQEKPATDQQGNSPINIMLGSPLLAAALQHVWILPFGEPALIKGDHHLLGVDFLPHILFGSTTDNPSAMLLRGVNSKNDMQVQHFCKCVVRQCNNHHLDLWIQELLAKAYLTSEDIHKLEAVDQTLTKILLQADCHCCPISQAPWSPEVCTAYMAHHYWALKLTAKQMEHNFSSALKVIADCLDPSLTTQDPNQMLSAQLKQAQKRLKQAHQNADALCKAHLESILNQAVAANHQKKTKALKYLIRAECNRQCYV